jgi:hypothetical protein
MDSLIGASQFDSALKQYELSQQKLRLRAIDLFFLFLYISCMKKFPRSFLGFGSVCAAVIVFSACNYIEPAPSMGNTEIVFFVALNDTSVSGTYEIVRLTMIDAEGTQLAMSKGPIEGKYRMILPEAAINETKKINFLVELKTQELLSDKIQTLAPNALARGYLRSRYAQIVHNEIPTNGQTITLTISNTELKVGYGPGHLKVSDLPYMPDFFKIQLDLTKTGIGSLLAAGYMPSLAVAIDTPIVNNVRDDPGLRFDLTKMPPINESDILGVASPDTGWFMIMESEINPGQDCRYWVFFTKDNAFATAHLYYHDAKIPELGGSVPIEPDFAGIPIPDVTTLKLLALDDAARAQISATLPVDISNLGESFVLTSPIYNLSTDFWFPIGRDRDSIRGTGFSPFTGLFDGGGYQIWEINLTGTATYEDYGLFGKVENATLQNFNFAVKTESLTFASIINADDTHAGILAGFTSGATLKNIKVLYGSFTVTRSGSADNYTGGVIGRKSGGQDDSVTCTTNVSASGGGTLYVTQKYGSTN